MLRGGPAQPRRTLKHARHPMQRIHAQPQWRVTPFEYKALNCDDNHLKIVQIILYASGALEKGSGRGFPPICGGGQTFQPEREVLLQICCRCSEGPNGLAMLAPASRPPLFERVIVTDKAVEAGNPVVKRPRRSVVLLRRPVEPVATALAGGPGYRFDELAADAAAPEGCVDKEILQVADLLGGPGMRVKEIVGDPDERRDRAALPRSQTADRAVRGDQPLPGVVVNLRRQSGLVKIEIAAPQLGPTVPVCRDNRVNDDFDQDGSPGSGSARVP
jgi:hypothetical protein